MVSLLAVLAAAALPGRVRPSGLLQDAATAASVVGIECRGAVDGVLVEGEPPSLLVHGVAPHERIKVHALRCLERWESIAGEWRSRAVTLHSFASFDADAAGAVEVDSSAPIAGTWRVADPLGLFWSGRPVGADAPLPTELVARRAPDAGAVEFALERSGKFVARSRVKLVAGGGELDCCDVREGALAGAYAHPPGDGPFPVIIVLHGSEGSSRDAARASALRFAARGFATFALSYFARPWLAIEGVATDAVNVPIECIEQARDWLEANSSVADVDRIGLYGVSKGAELTLVALSEFDWLRAGVACVPSDVVFEGYGRAPHDGELCSSWTVAGRSLPYVSYLPFDAYLAAHPGNNAANWHAASREAAGAARAADARIPVERIAVPLLLLAGGKDEVWPSAAMARSVAAQMEAAGSGDRVVLRVFEQANHQIAGTGAEPVFLHSTAPRGEHDADPLDVGVATAAAWRATIAFLREELGAER